MNRLNRDTHPIRMRNYGRILQNMIEYACTIENEEERRALTQYIGRCMMQKNRLWNSDQENDFRRVAADIRTLSDGQLSLD